jgi:pimeloyl-ACP methyl ester carboxylesterase
MQNREGLDIDRILDEVRGQNWQTVAPLVVLTHGRPDSSPEEEEDWRDMQADHARRSPTGRLIVAERSGHDIQLDQPDLVIEAIREVVGLARSGR